MSQPIPKMKQLPLTLVPENVCYRCDNEANWECSVTGQDYCSHHCREKELDERARNFEQERVAEITSGGQV
jgi:hypothetical protein